MPRFERKFSDEEIASAYEKAGSISGASRLSGADRKTVRLRLRGMGLLREEAATPANRKDREVLNLRNEVKHLKNANKKLTARLLDQENLVERIVAEASAPLPKPRFRAKRSSGKRPRDMILYFFLLRGLM